MNKKAEQFKKDLKDLNLENLQIQEIDDKFHTVIFRSNLDINHTLLPFIIYIDDSIYTVFRIQIVAGAVTEEKKKHVMEYINGLNRQYKIFKYYITTDGGILLDCCIPFASEKAFDSTLVRAFIDIVGKHLLDEYAAMMKEIWG